MWLIVRNLEKVIFVSYKLFIICSLQLAAWKSYFSSYKLFINASLKVMYWPLGKHLLLSLVVFKTVNQLTRQGWLEANLWTQFL